MKYYQLMRYADNAVGAVFYYCNENELENVIAEFEPDDTREITKERYDEEIERNKKRAFYLMTGHWV